MQPPRMCIVQIRFSLFFYYYYFSFRGKTQTLDRRLSDRLETGFCVRKCQSSCTVDTGGVRRRKRHTGRERRPVASRLHAMAESYPMRPTGSRAVNERQLVS